MNDLPERISRYQVRTVLGVGGFGIVVCAFDEALDAQVAVKVLAHEHAQDPVTRERFVREAQLLRRVHSAHVIAVHDIGELDDGRPYLVMELATGGALAQRIVAGRPADAPGVRATITALASGLGALHAAGIVHRDVTPGNLLVVDDSQTAGDGTATVQRQGLLTGSERIVVADLGLAKDQDRTTAGPTIVGGTPRFRSPEQTRRGEEIGPAADIFGATGVLWNLLTGEPPEPESLQAQLTTVPTAWRYVFERGLAFEPNERFATMAEWETAALEALDSDTAARDVGFRAATAGATCPYKGLTAFQAHDASFFFGRETLVEELVVRMQSSSTLVIGGPSGSGKSSLLRAGLVPAIGSGALPGSQHWPVLLFTPGSGPLDELALQLGRLTPDRAAPGTDELRLDPRAARRWLPTGTAGLLAIDQFEEIFTHETEPVEVRAVLDVLDALTTSQDAQIRVLIALRSDFYSTCAGYPWLAERISENQVLVGPMRRHELRRAIEGPARRAGLRIEPGLTEAVLDEAGEEPGGLPLIAHALMETWIRRRGTVLTLDGFQAAGGVIGAIAQSAEHAYERLTEPDRITARRLFLRLITPGDDGPDTRRRLSWADLRDDARTSAVVERLAADRLLTVDERGVELVHETLIRAWPRLRGWIDESREDLRVRHRIARAANEWIAEDRDPDLLYRGAPLTGVLEWQESAHLELSEVPAAFLDASRAARDAEESAASAARHRRRRLRRIAFATLSVLAAAAITATVVAFFALRQSQHNEAEAERRFARGLATQAESLAPTRPKLALALAVESAARLDAIPAEAQQAIVMARLALAASDIVAASEPIPVGDALTALVTPDGSTVVTGTRDGAVQLVDARTGEATATLTGPNEGIEEAAVDSSGRWLVAVGADGLWRWDLDSDTTQGEHIAQSSGALWSAAFSADGEHLATAAEDGIVTVYSTSSWKPDGEPMRSNIDFLSVAFTRRGDQVLAGTGDGRVFVWDLATRRLVGSPLAAHGTNDVWELAMDPSGERVATASSDGTASVWSLATGALVASPFVTVGGERTLDAVAGLVWSRDGGSLYAGGGDGRLHEWDLDSRSEIDTSMIGHDDRVVDAAASADGTRLVTLGRDQDARLWDMADREPTMQTVEQFDVPLYGIALSDDSTTIAVGDDRGVVHVISPDAPTIELRGHAGRVFGLTFLADGTLVSGDDAGTLRRWDPASGQLLASHEDASPGPITSIAAGPTGDLIATSSADGGIRLWKTDDFEEPVAQTASQARRANKVVFTSAGDVVASYGDGRVRFWHRDGSEARAPLMVDDDLDAVFSLAVSPDDRWLAVATATDGVTIWDLDTDQQRNELNGQPIDPVDVAFTPDGSAIVSSTRHGVVTLWNSSTGQAIGPRFQNHTEAVWRLAAMPTSAVVFAGGDGMLSSLDALDLTHACALGAGSLDRRARDRYLGDREPMACSD